MRIFLDSTINLSGCVELDSFISIVRCFELNMDIAASAAEATYTLDNSTECQKKCRAKAYCYYFTYQPGTAECRSEVLTHFLDGGYER